MKDKVSSGRSLFQVFPKDEGEAKGRCSAFLHNLLFRPLALPFAEF